MKRLSQLLPLLLIWTMGCQSKLKPHQYELSIILAQPIKSGQLPQELISLCMPIEVSDSIFLNSNTEAGSPVVYSAFVPKVRQLLYGKTDNLGSNIFKANDNQARIARQIQSNLSSVRLNADFAKISPEQGNKRLIDSLLTEARSKGHTLLIFGKNSTDSLYEGIRVYYQTDSVRQAIATAFLRTPAPDQIWVLYGLDISGLKKQQAPAMQTVAAIRPAPAKLVQDSTRPAKPERSSGYSIAPARTHVKASTPVKARQKDHQDQRTILDDLTDEEARSGKITSKDLHEKSDNR